MTFSNPTSTKTFTAALHTHGSGGSADQGTHESTMDFYDQTSRGYINWDIPTLEMSEEIGLTFEFIDGKRYLTDYDGIMALPREAAEMLESIGVVVGEDFR